MMRLLLVLAVATLMLSCSKRARLEVLGFEESGELPVRVTEMMNAMASDDTLRSMEAFKRRYDLNVPGIPVGTASCAPRTHGDMAAMLYTHYWLCDDLFMELTKVSRKGLPSRVERVRLFREAAPHPDMGILPVFP